MKKFILFMILSLLTVSVSNADLTLTAGEGIDLSSAGAGADVTVTGEDATTANKGIASFNDSYFGVSSGAVSIDDIYLLNSGDTATGIYNFDSNTFVVRSDLNNVGIGMSTPSTALEVSGTVTATAFAGPLTGNVTGNASGSAASITGDLDVDQLTGDTVDNNLIDAAILPATTSYLGTSIETGEITDSTIVTADINWDAFVVDDGSINWAVQVPLAETDPVWSAWDGSTGINWEAAISGINWTLIDTVKLNGINWDYYAGGGTSVWGENDSTAYYTDGNVGVGVSVATQALHVSGGVRLASLNCSGNANGGALTTDANGVVSCSDDDSGAGSGVNNGVINAFAYYPAAGTTVDDQTALYLDGGNVGIGISTASQKLQVSGTVLATAFSGPLTGNVTGDLTGNAATATTASTANAGDSATAFFSAGTIEHERGGLEADVSAYNGFVKISGGSTSAVTANGGTDLTADLEEETHASEHAVSAADTVFPADPNADKYLMWDDDPGALSWQTVSQEWTEAGGILAPTTGTDDVAVDTNVFYVDVSANNVGVGTSVPSQKLQVAGTVLATAFSGPLTGNVTGTATNVADADYGDVTVSSGAWAVEDDSHAHVYSNIDATTSSNWASVVSDETGTGAWVFATGPTLAGNVGIGATGPNELSVVGEVAIGTTAYTNRASPTSGLRVEGNVGIGTTATVTSKLVVGGTSGIVSFTGVTSDPCSTAPVGSIFYNSTANVLCYCNGSNADIQVGVGSTTPCF